MTAIRLIARPMLASVFFVGAASALKNAPTLAPKASRVTDKVVPARPARGAERSDPDRPGDAGPGQRRRPDRRRRRAGDRPAAAPVVRRCSPASLLPTTIAGHAVLARGGPRRQEHPAAELLQGHLPGRRPPDRRRRHRGQAGRRLACPPCRPRRTSGGAGPWPARRGPRRGSPRPTWAEPSRAAARYAAPVTSGPWRAPFAHGPVRADVSLPGSKSLTNRALVLAALADGPERRTTGPAVA